MPTKPVLQFLGAAQTVTGSKFLLLAAGQEVLVECGLFQGLKELRQRNWSPLPVDPEKIDAVVLTHAHLDHSGWLPRLTKQGFRGAVWSTPATRELLELMLPDSGHLQEEEARFANKTGYSKHTPAEPLYTEEEARASLRQLKTLDYGRELEIAPGIRARFHPSGHILGAAFVEVTVDGSRIVLSGDVGGYDSEIMRGPAPLPAGVGHVVVESTYGGRSNDARPMEEQVRDHVRPVLERGGIVVIPAFAVGRTTILLYHLRKLQERREIPDAPVFVDSPMATDAVEIYCRYGDEHNLRVDLLKDGAQCPILTRRTHFVRTREESKELNRHAGPAIIISASGMATGGRVLHHLKHRLPDPRNLILLAGFQAIGTRGRALLDGVREVKMHGELVPVRAKVASVRGLSAHGDADDLIRWLRTAKTKPKAVHLVHGEPEAIRAMAERVRGELGMNVHAPQYLEKTTL